MVSSISCFPILSDASLVSLVLMRRTLWDAFPASATDTPQCAPVPLVTMATRFIRPLTPARKDGPVLITAVPSSTSNTTHLSRILVSLPEDLNQFIL